VCPTTRAQAPSHGVLRSPQRHKFKINRTQKPLDRPHRNKPKKIAGKIHNQNGGGGGFSERRPHSLLASPRQGNDSRKQRVVGAGAKNLSCRNGRDSVSLRATSLFYVLSWVCLGPRGSFSAVGKTGNTWRFIQDPASDAIEIGPAMLNAVQLKPQRDRSQTCPPNRKRSNTALVLKRSIVSSTSVI